MDYLNGFVPDVECKRCDGNGWIEVRRGGLLRGVHQEDCPDCLGNGWRPMTQDEISDAAADERVNGHDPIEVHPLYATPTPVEERANAATSEQVEAVEICSDCPPIGYPTDQTRCVECLRRTSPHAAKQQTEPHDHDWRLAVAKLAGQHGIRYRTNSALEDFLAAIAALEAGR